MKNNARRMDTEILWEMANPEKPMRGHAISDYMPVISQMFPGINYFSISGFSQVMKEIACPCVAKLHPELKDCATSEEAIQKYGATLLVKKVKASRGYQWQDSASWRSTLAKKMQIVVGGPGFHIC